MIPHQKDHVPHAPQMPVAGNWYGTTIQVYDPALDAWRIYYGSRHWKAEASMDNGTSWRLFVEVYARRRPG